MIDCIFCQIARREISAYVVYESDNFISFLDIHPHAPGHTLLIPKDHYASFKEVPPQLGEEFLKASQETISILTKALQTENFTLGINEGRLAGQVIPHFHFHFIPRFNNDGGGSIHAVVFNPQNISLEEVFQKIKNAH